MPVIPGVLWNDGYQAVKHFKLISSIQNNHNSAIFSASSGNNYKYTLYTVK